jgi:hypothetical protein
VFSRHVSNQIPPSREGLPADMADVFIPHKVQKSVLWHWLDSGVTPVTPGVKNDIYLLYRIRYI